MSMGYVEAPIQSLAATLDDMGLAERKVGLELNYVTAADFAQLTAKLPKMRAVDSAPIMDHVRAQKTEGEIARLKIGADILDDAFLACFPTAKPGTRERDLHGALVAHCLQGGAEFVHGILNSGRNTIAYGGESDFAFAAGDAIRTDYVCYVKAYPGHQSRCAVIGRASDRQKQECAIARDVYLDSCRQLRPGRRAGEVYDFVVKRFAKEGLDYHHMIAGHSVGAWWHQRDPVISRDNPRLLEDGMVIAMEPRLGHWHIQDMWVVRPNGPAAKMSTERIFEATKPLTGSACRIGPRLRTQQGHDLKAEPVQADGQEHDDGERHDGRADIAQRRFPEDAQREFAHWVVQDIELIGIEAEQRQPA
jgi:Xaa-Pro aminopeptidase